MKVICGQAPAIPWWRLQDMSDADIAGHNSKYLMEVEVTERVGMLKLTVDLGKPGMLVELSDKDMNWHSIRLDKDRVERLKKFLNETPLE